MQPSRENAQLKSTKARLTLQHFKSVGLLASSAGGRFLISLPFLVLYESSFVRISNKTRPHLVENTGTFDGLWKMHHISVNHCKHNLQLKN